MHVDALCLSVYFCVLCADSADEVRLHAGRYRSLDARAGGTAGGGRAARVPRARVRWQPARTTSRERLRSKQPRLHGPVLPAARNALSQGAHHR